MKRRSPVLGVAVLALLLASAPAAHAGCGGTQIRHTQHKRNTGRAPLIIGDSVLLGAMKETTAAGFNLNTRGCRQWSEGMQVLRDYKRRGFLPHLVVMELGTDWTVSVREIRAAMSLVGPSRVLGLMTPREVGGYGGSDAAHMRSVARRFPNRTLLLDWVAHTRGRGGWFQPDGIHLTLSGAAGFGEFLKTALPYADPPEQVIKNPPTPVDANPPPPPPPPTS
ncbi:MAG TPA: hypothetical protein VFL73_03810 [Solirubrobacteraceae bacterium]|nr:hypothetical protein [Solirubrobacteraceae bacterium]